MRNKTKTVQQRLLEVYLTIEEISTRLGDLKLNSPKAYMQLGVLHDRLEKAVKKLGNAIQWARPEGSER